MIQIYDPIEKELPPPGDYYVSDGTREVRFRSQDKALKQKYRSAFERRTQIVRQLAKKLGAVYIHCCTDDNPLAVIQKTFGTRR